MNNQIFIPAICNINGKCEIAGESTLAVLHHETGQEASEYPLNLKDGSFFSEIYGSNFLGAEIYKEHIINTLNLIRLEINKLGFLPYESINSVGEQIQNLDAGFARQKIGLEPDRVHKQWGPSAEHPYRKITLCRTTLPVKMPDGIKNFFFEKFLVVYSYLDENGTRRSTVTPIHSHPYNHEVVYFIKHGPESRVVEKEYTPTDKSNKLLFLEDGTLNPELVDQNGELNIANLQVQFKKEEVVEGTNEPVILKPFDSELQLRNPNFIFQSDGLFRPHQVTVYDDAVEGTLYYAFNNYWGPLARVILYNDSGKPVIWSHKEWEK